MARDKEGKEGKKRRKTTGGEAAIAAAEADVRPAARVRFSLPEEPPAKRR
jgi:hypothetical protein